MKKKMQRKSSYNKSLSDITEAEAIQREKEISAWLNRSATTTTKEVVVERPVEKVVYKDTVCPPCPDCPEPKVIKVDKLTVKGDGDIYVKPKSTKTDNTGNKKTNGVVVNEDWLVGDACIVSTPMGDIDAKFAVAELNDLIPSNDPLNNFNWNKKYPKECQERDYKKDGNLVGNILQRINDFNPDFLISTNNTATDGAIIVNENGVVLGGNSRTMLLILVADQAPDKWNKYYDKLASTASWFGVDAGALSFFKHPVLVRVVNESADKNCAWYSRALNETFTIDTFI